MFFISYASTQGIEHFLISNIFQVIINLTIDTNFLSKQEPPRSRANSLNSKSEAMKLETEFEIALREKFSYLSIPTEKIERDDLKLGFESYANSLYRKMVREMKKKEDWIWRNKQEEERKNCEYIYIQTRYSKMMSRCPLFNSLKEANQQVKHFSKYFIQMHGSRDELLRAKKVNQMKSMKEISCLSCSYGFLRRFILKKCLIMQVLGRPLTKAEMLKLFEKDFYAQNELIKKVFVCLRKSKDAIFAEDQRVLERKFLL